MVVSVLYPTAVFSFVRFAESALTHTAVLLDHVVTEDSVLFPTAVLYDHVVTEPSDQNAQSTVFPKILPPPLPVLTPFI